MIKFIYFLYNFLHKIKFQYRYIWKNMHNYELYNPNPKFYETGDCSVRAISKYLNISWKESYDILAKSGREMGYMMDDSDNVYNVLHSFNLSPIHIYNKLLYVDELAKMLDNTNISILCDCHRDNNEDMHLVAIINGQYYDSYDSGDFIVDDIFVSEENKHHFNMLSQNFI